ncbi:UPF0101 protein CGI-137, putative [Babesia caballi]|uniref:Adenylate kinase isoenzyme 6 homolog n=1 Tax=Babesia caballi TaxID=5871 RepID=A0AAV4LUT4_BABCB|nr:UPF0101 protein CGI-137, putative [Babesia caballi]
MRENGPNILVTGTPGVGKTTLCRRFAAESGLKHLNVAELIEEQKLHAGWDEELQCSIYDDRKLRKALARLGLSSGGFLLDFHSVEGIDEDDVDHVVVLSVEIETLSKRLAARGYPDRKIDENVEAEIFKVCLQDAADLFGAERVTELPHNTEEESLRALEHIKRLADGLGRQYAVGDVNELLVRRLNGVFAGPAHARYLRQARDGGAELPGPGDLRDEVNDAGGQRGGAVGGAQDHGGLAGGVFAERRELAGHLQVRAQPGDELRRVLHLRVAAHGQQLLEAVDGAAQVLLRYLAVVDHHLLEGARDSHLAARHVQDGQDVERVAAALEVAAVVELLEDLLAPLEHQVVGVDGVPDVAQHRKGALQGLLRALVAAHDVLDLLHFARAADERGGVGVLQPGVVDVAHTVAVVARPRARLGVEAAPFLLVRYQHVLRHPAAGDADLVALGVVDHDDAGIAAVDAL